MKDSWTRRHWTTGDSSLLEWIALQNTSDTPKDPWQILIDNEEPETEDDTTDLSFDQIAKVLTQKEADILWYYYYEGETLQQIAKRLGYQTPSAVWKKKKKAIGKLRKHYANKEP